MILQVFNSQILSWLLSKQWKPLFKGLLNSKCSMLGIWHPHQKTIPGETILLKSAFHQNPSTSTHPTFPGRMKIYKPHKGSNSLSHGISIQQKDPIPHHLWLLRAHSHKLCNSLHIQKTFQVSSSTSFTSSIVSPGGNKSTSTFEQNSLEPIDLGAKMWWFKTHTSRNLVFNTKGHAKLTTHPRSNFLYNDRALIKFLRTNLSGGQNVMGSKSILVITWFLTQKDVQNS